MTGKLRRRTNAAPEQEYLPLNQLDLKQNGSTRHNVKSKRRRTLLVFKILLPALCVCHFLCPFLFGEHPVHGGYVGMLVDMRIKIYLWNKKLKDSQKEAAAFGLQMKGEFVRTRIQNVPQCILIELIRRHSHKKKMMKNMMDHRNVYVTVEDNPKIVLRQRHIWSRPFPESSGYVALDLDMDDMDSYMNRQAEKKNTNLVQTYNLLNENERAELFFVAFLSDYGGVYIDSRCSRDEIQRTLAQSSKLVMQNKAGWVYIKNEMVLGFLVPPNHPYFTCIITQKYDVTVLGDGLGSISLFRDIVQKHASRASLKGEESVFVQLSESCSKDFLNFTSISNDYHLGHMSAKGITVTIHADNEPKPQYTTKSSIDQLMSQKSIFCSGLWMWMCHRCLKSALRGTYASCASVCDPCTGIMYSEPTEPNGENVVHVKVAVRGFEADGKSQMIPRIIHQTWREKITPDTYPNLYRIQNMWKSSGWSYRFYTDETARQYIIDNFPRHFLEAYDALIPGAYKADLFRYMLLMKDGGIYADMDVLLDVSLDSFITPTMSFFVPRDAVAAYADGEYCLWNGIIGAAPGHPIVIRAVERLVNLILNRADLLDLEKEVAERSGIDTETWKVRAIQELLLSGPCALGIAANEVLGRDPVARFDVGWLKESKSKNQDMGDVLILMVRMLCIIYPVTRLSPTYSRICSLFQQDKDDLGSMRFTDVERNIMFASTDLPGLNKDRLHPTGARPSQVRTIPHYSKTGKGFWLWGTRNVYTDSFVSTASISVHTEYIK